MSYEEQLKVRFPLVAWQVPLICTKDKRLACRFCICIEGLQLEKIANFSRTPEEFSKHMAFAHNPPAIFEKQTNPK